MTVKQLIAQLQLLNQELEVVYGYTEYDSIHHSDTYLWGIDDPHIDIKDGETVVNLGALSNQSQINLGVIPKHT